MCVYLRRGSRRRHCRCPRSRHVGESRRPCTQQTGKSLKAEKQSQQITNEAAKQKITGESMSRLGKLHVGGWFDHDTTSRVLRFLSGQNSMTKVAKLQNSTTFEWEQINLSMCKLNVLFKCFASVIDKYGYLSDLSKHLLIWGVPEDCVTGRNRNIINKEIWGNLNNLRQ